MSGGGPVQQPHVLREYSLLADGERGAVLGPRGDIVWMCAPRWHDGSVFSALIGGQGSFSLTPQCTYIWGGSYDEASMIWRSRWVTTEGIVESREALAYPGDEHRAVLLRRVHAKDRAARVEFRLEPRGDYDRKPLTDLHRDGDVWTGRVGSLYLRVLGAGAARPKSDGTRLEFVLALEAGQQHDFVLEISDEVLPDEPPVPDLEWQGTESAWRSAVPPLTQTLNPRDSRRSYAVLAGLTSKTGGMVAAATTSLPERAEAGRNYDYRYAWIRDQCYAGHAVASTGGGALLDAAVTFVAARIIENGHQLAPAYAVTGEPVPDQSHLGLPGYPGGGDQIGNQVNKQFQLDAFGEALQLFAVADDLGQFPAELWPAVHGAADAIADRWQEPDAGIWEIEPRAWTHSRLTAAAGLRAIATRSGAGHRQVEWLALADRIVADTSAHALHPDGHWQRAVDDPGLDAALLLPALREAVPINDPRSKATFAAYLEQLTEDEYAYRFRHDDRPLSEAEGSFLLCGFLVALTHDRMGNRVLARSWYDTTRAAVGPPQLFSEEYDAIQHQMRGNLPQAFVHALHLETAAELYHDDTTA